MFFHRILWASSLIILIVLSSCSLNSPNYLRDLSDDWTELEVWYYSENGIDIMWDTVAPQSSAIYFIRKSYYLRLNDSVTVEKQVTTDMTGNIKKEETDIYRKRLNEFIEMNIAISYDFSSRSHFAYCIDSIGNKAKIKLNQIEAGKAKEFADSNSLMLCGTSYYSILYNNIPEFYSFREIEVDSAVQIIHRLTEGKTEGAFSF